MHSLSILVAGAAGRMGKEVVKIAEATENLRVVAAVDRAGKNERRQMPDVKPGSVEMVIDFSSPELFRDVLLWCEQREVPLVSGTTGLTETDFARMDQVAQTIPLLWAPNMSLGIALMRQLIQQFHSVAQQFDFQIEEFHHRHKKDHPSGTAKLLQEDLEQYLGESMAAPVSIRGGGIFGIHRFHAMANEETLMVEHTALNRTVFARGAVNAAQWLQHQNPGRYELGDVISGVVNGQGS